MPIKDGHENAFVNCILPINEESFFRVAVKSHLLQKAQNSKFLYHRESVIELKIPPTCCILFYNNKTIHGGGRSQKTNIRCFAILGPSGKFGSTQSMNYTGIVEECKNECKTCLHLEAFKSRNDGGFLPKGSEIRKFKKVLQFVNDFDPEEHSFGILKVAKEVGNGVLNQTNLIGNDCVKGLKFLSLGQEKRGQFNSNGEPCDGKREIIDIGNKLNAEEVMSKTMTFTHVDGFLNSCLANACEYLKRKMNVEYEVKGKNLLRSKGELGNQILHLDGKPNCSCK